MSMMKRAMEMRIQWLAWNVADVHGDFENAADYEERIWRMWERWGEKAIQRIAGRFGWEEPSMDEIAVNLRVV